MLDLDQVQRATSLDCEFEPATQVLLGLGERGTTLLELGKLLRSRHECLGWPAVYALSVIHECFSLPLSDGRIIFVDCVQAGIFLEGLRRVLIITFTLSLHRVPLPLLLALPLPAQFGSRLLLAQLLLQLRVACHLLRPELLRNQLDCLLAKFIVLKNLQELLKRQYFQLLAVLKTVQEPPHKLLISAQTHTQQLLRQLLHSQEAFILVVPRLEYLPGQLDVLPLIQHLLAVILA